MTTGSINANRHQVLLRQVARVFLMYLFVSCFFIFQRAIKKARPAKRARRAFKNFEKHLTYLSILLDGCSTVSITDGC